MSEIQDKIEALQRRHAAVTQKRASLAGQLQAKRDELAALVREIREAGYDPKSIGQERDRVKAELDSMISTAEAEMDQAEAVLAGFPDPK